MLPTCWWKINLEFFSRTCPQGALPSPLHRQFAEDGFLGKGGESSPRVCGKNQLNLITHLITNCVNRQSLFSSFVVLPGEPHGGGGAPVGLEERLWCSRHWQDLTLPQIREYLFIKKVPTISLLVVWFNVLAQLLCAVSVQQIDYNKSSGYRNIFSSRTSHQFCKLLS